MCCWIWRSIRKPFSFSARCAAAVALFSIVAGAAAQTAPTTQPPYSENLTREQRVERLFNYLTQEYARQTTSKDWITRSVAVISLAQFPTDDATKTILDRLNKETHSVGRLVAWQAVLARASLLTEPQFKQWQQATAKMIKDDLFHGDLRIALMEMLSST